MMAEPVSISVPKARPVLSVATVVIGALTALWGVSALGYHVYAMAVVQNGVLRGLSIGPRFFILLGLAAAGALSLTGIHMLLRDRRTLRLAIISTILVPLTAWLGLRFIGFVTFCSPGGLRPGPVERDGLAAAGIPLLLLLGLTAYLLLPRTRREFGPWEGPPFSLPIWERIWRDYWYIAAICGATLFAFHWLVITFLPLYDMRYRLQLIKRLPDIVRAMIGQDLYDIISWTSIGAFAYLHPVTLAVLVAFAVMMPSWILVGQIDRGTVELLLSTPLTRKKMVYTSTLAAMVGGALLIGAMLLGTWIGIHHIKLTEPFRFSRILVVAINLYAMYLLTMSASVFFSCVTSIRGMAVGWTVGVCVGAYLIHFLAEWWPPVTKIAFLGPLYYFRPIKIATGSYDPTFDIAVLLAASAVFMAASAIWFSRRDIAVV
jgi:ABC-2 type transport system permease protein